ncbi:hypothetical protein M1L60_41600 [Actinoplanes sp. TRM 88003]|uniref:Uncharacterized protein n=1 Tax=Paractinoplanes aksuensis TaxID=2939490 RepID=A0ABT1E4L7_9ACTN|nr:hypothetical protein [Actinoplanes aksuensis]MCO8277090.1 hypothetical protein [Actinoplanes aksuensis]
MKVLSDFSVLVKIALTGLLLGFALGLCATGMSWTPPMSPAEPAPTSPADQPLH